MARKYTELMFTNPVKDAQAHYGSRITATKMEAWDLADDRLSAIETDFIAERDGFYMATVNEDGWPYLQFRGGPAGFLRPLDDRTLGYADFRGNRQYISTGNLAKNDRVALFFMDYPKRRRLKLMASTEIFDAADRPDLVEQLEDPGYHARIERVVLFHVVAFDWNCPQHITPRFTMAEIDAEGARHATTPKEDS